jgi:hypothetical protein
MSFAKITIFLLVFVLHSAYSYGQKDSTIPTIPNITEVPLKFIQTTNNKIDKYSNRITSKMKKNLEKLSKFEEKIHKLLLKANPTVAEQLFGAGRITFASMLAKVKEGKALSENYKSSYDAYCDKLVTNIKYLETQKEGLNKKYILPLQSAKEKAMQLEKDVAETEAAQALIKERKKELLAEAYKVLGKSKYFKKISKQEYYYFEYLKEYKSIFNDETKLEKTAIELIKKIPGFEKFASENSALAGLFGNFSLQGGGGGNSIPIVNGLAPRSQVMQGVQAVVGGAGVGFNPMDMITQQMPDVKNKFANLLGGSGGADAELPDFKPNTQKVKSFLKRLDYSSEIQFGAANNFLPTTANIAMTVGYKLNDKFSTGAGMSYILGLGQGWNNLKLSSEGVGFGTYLKMKMKKGFNVQGGSEWNYNTHFNKIIDLKNNGWQQTALLGFTKSMKAGKKAKSEIKLLYDFLHNSHRPSTQPFIFRVGYHF